MVFFGRCKISIFLKFIFVMGAIEDKGIPQGLKPLSSSTTERPKAEALGYLEAKSEGMF
jgi:hypothetical protein